MLITFKSDADGDVIMFGKIGQQMLATLGKDPDDGSGIITVAQLPAAIETLRAAIEADRLARAAEEEEEADDDHWDPHHHDQPKAQEEPEIHFCQRAQPLLDMLVHSERVGVAVLWEAA